ncbi:MAG: single-stranded DNA-binding protein [Patescibacteria group bacterium]|nr:single-stranded DNA-binding protein [Patescibacteria group bacterium]
MNFNKTIIVGRITKDPETRTTPNGQTVASIGVATNRVWNTNGGERQEKVEYHSIVAWGKLAEICGQYLSKGQLVLFEGRLETRTWEGQDGVKRSKTEIIAENMQMGPRTKSQGEESFQQNEERSNKDNVDQKQTKEQSEVKSSSDDEEIKIEDIPF